MPSQENKPSARELDSASPLKTHLVSSDSNIVALVEKYLEKIKKSSHSTRFPESKIRSQLLILICNLIWVNRKNNQWIYQGRGKPSFSHTRYFHTLTHDIFVKRILNNLVALGLIEQRIGFRKLTKTKLTRIRARGILKRDVTRIASPTICVREDFEIIQVQKTIKSWFDVKTRKTVKVKAKFDYVDTVETRRKRANLKQINKKIEGTFLGLWIKDTDYKKLYKNLKKKEKHEFNLNEKFLVRIFNDTNFQLGGRFYHGWWQALPRVYRPYITINHQVVAELDYKHLHPALMYSKIGCTELPLNFDSYTLDIKGFGPRHRAAIKQTFQCLINTDSEKSALSAIKSKGLSALFPFGPRVLMDQLIEKHAPISEMFFDSDLGKKLQRIDSDIAEYCMLEMLNSHKTLVLPVHDSFIVQQDMITVLQEVMSTAYKHFTDNKIAIDEKGFTLWHPFDRLSCDDLEHYKRYEEQSSWFLKKHSKESNLPFMPPDVFPEDLLSAEYIDEL